MHSHTNDTMIVDIQHDGPSPNVHMSGAQSCMTIVQLFSIICRHAKNTCQGSKLGWSCGPSLPKLLSDHQIMLGGSPVVYRKTHHKGTLFKKKLIGTDHFYAFMSFSVLCYVLQGLFKCFEQENVNYVRCV